MQYLHNSVVLREPGPGKLRSGRDGPLQGVNSASAMPQATWEDLNILYKWYFLKTIF